MEPGEKLQNIHEPDFKTDTFEINFLSDNPQGFEVRTRKSRHRHAPNTPLPFAKRIAEERKKEKNNSG